MKIEEGASEKLQFQVLPLRSQISHVPEVGNDFLRTDRLDECPNYIRAKNQGWTITATLSTLILMQER